MRKTAKFRKHDPWDISVNDYHRSIRVLRFSKSIHIIYCGKISFYHLFELGVNASDD